jgi:hypothetical protein
MVVDPAGDELLSRTATRLPAFEDADCYFRGARDLAARRLQAIEGATVLLPLRLLIEATLAIMEMEHQRAHHGGTSLMPWRNGSRRLQ